MACEPANQFDDGSVDGLADGYAGMDMASG